MSEPVLLSTADGVARLTLNRPEAGNGLDLAMARGLTDKLGDIRDDTAVRAVLLTGNGRLFCGGGDVLGMRDASDRSAFILELAHEAHRAVRVLADLEKPIVCAVQGAAAGAGLSLALLSDIVVAAPSASFVTAYTSIGLTPDCGQSWLLPRAIGTSRALDLTLRSRRVSASDAAAWGLVAELADDPIRAAEAIAAGLASGPAHAHGAARALARRSFGDAFSAHLDAEAETIAAAASAPSTSELLEQFGRPRS